MAQQGASLISQIPQHELERFKQIVNRFRDRWQVEFSGKLTAENFQSSLPPASDPLFRAALIEIVAIDLVTRMDRREPISLLDYLALEIGLGPREQLPVELLQVEFMHRLRSANPIQAIDYAALFPAQSAELMKRIQSMDPQPQNGTLICSPIDDDLVIEPISLNASSRSQIKSPAVDAASDNRAEAKPDVWGTVRTSSDPTVRLDNGYLLIRRIGRGNFGEVWLSEAPGGIEVALKIVRLPASQRNKHVELRSLDLMKRMRHPYLIQVQAFWVSTEQILIAMELADQSLQDRARECIGQSIPLPELLSYMTEAAEGIDYLHREHVVHRDIKPDNLLLLKGHVKVADFGLARLLDETGLTVVATQVAGSPMYMAPEVWNQKPVPNSDQYSLAVAYAELRLGHTPFSASSLVEAMQAHLYGQPKLTGISEREQTVLRKALSKNTQDRFATCSEMVAAMVEAASPLVAPQSLLDANSKNRSSWSLQAILISAAGLAAIAFLLWFSISLLFRPPLAIKLRDVEVAYGGKDEIEISTVDSSDSIQQITFSDKPSGISFDFDKSNNLLTIAADLNSPVGESFSEMAVSTTRGKITKKLRVKVVESDSLRLPDLTQPSKHNPRRYRSDSDKRILYENIEYALPSGERIEFLLIPRQSTNDPPSFYIMKQEVTNRWFAEFATIHPEKISVDSLWRQGAASESGPLGVDGDFIDYPVVFVKVEECHAFAEWVGGLLPNEQQWDKASGAYVDEKTRGKGPFVDQGLRVCVDRASLGPLRAGTSLDDTSPFGVLDFSGSVTEFTRNIIRNNSTKLDVPLSDHFGEEKVILRGHSYHDPKPWTFDLMDDQIPPKLLYDDSKPEIGFRVVIELL